MKETAYSKNFSGFDTPELLKAYRVIRAWSSSAFREDQYEPVLRQLSMGAEVKKIKTLINKLVKGVKATSPYSYGSDALAMYGAYEQLAHELVLRNFQEKVTAFSFRG